MAFKVEADFKRNRLHFTVPENITKKNLDRFYTELRFCVCDLNPNFDVVADFSKCSLMYLDSTGTLNSVMRYLVAKRIREKVRVVSDNLFCKQLKNFTSRERIYEPTYVTSVQEAEHHLENNQRRNGLRIYLKERTAQCLVDGTEMGGPIINMSTSGCAMEQGEEVLSLTGEGAMLSFALRDSNSIEQGFEIRSEIVRSEKGMIAMKFLDLDEDRKDILWNCLLNEAGITSV
jgi:hypothetical protein